MYSVFKEMTTLRTDIIDILLENKCNILAYATPPLETEKIPERCSFFQQVIKQTD